MSAGGGWRTLRAVRGLALLGALLVGVVIVSSAWIRHVQSGLACDDRAVCYRPVSGSAAGVKRAEQMEGSTTQGGNVPARAGSATAQTEHLPARVEDVPMQVAHGRQATSLARLAHRISATTVTVVIVAILVIGWMVRPLPRGIVSSAVALAVVSALLAVVGIRWMGLDLPIVTLANLVGGMAMLALFGRLLARSSDKPTGAPPARSPNDSAPAHARTGTAGARTATARSGAAAAGLRSTPNRRLAQLLVVAMFVQVGIGGLVSAHFAGLSCLGDPSCRVGAGAPWSIGDWNPLRAPTDPWLRTAGQAAAMAALETAHRIVAAGVTVLALFVSALGARVPSAIRRPCRALGGLAIAQVLIGMTIVTFALPLAGVLAHNAAAALMLFAATFVAARPSGAAWRTAAITPTPAAAAGTRREGISVG